MDFISYSNLWLKQELFQGRIMMGSGVLLLIAVIGILRSENELLKGSLIPLGLLLVILIGYGSYILYSRPAHVAASTALYEQSTEEAIEKEKTKHINDNKAGNTLLRIYPLMLLLSAMGLFFLSSPYYKGLSLGIAVLSISIFIIDSGFVTRSDAFLDFLNGLAEKMHPE